MFDVWASVRLVEVLFCLGLFYVVAFGALARDITCCC